MLKIIGQTSVKLAALLAAACVAADEIPSPATLAQPGRAAIEIDDAQVSLYNRPAGSYVRTPIVSDTTTYKNEKTALGASSVSEGYVVVKHAGSAGKIKIQITKGGSETYAYDLNNSGVYEVFPLSEGSGSYRVEVFEDIQSNQYSQAFSQSVDAGATDQFNPFLYPNQYVNFSAASTAVQVGAVVAAGASDQIEVVAAIYNYMIDNASYDTAKTASVQSGYLPNVNVVLAQKKGICFGYTALTTTMLRPQDIPTKLVVGCTGDLYHAWVNVYLEGQGWMDNITYLDGSSWKLVDPTFAPSSGQSREIVQYINNGANYKAKYSY